MLYLANLVRARTPNVPAKFLVFVRKLVFIDLNDVLIVVYAVCQSVEVLVLD
jgi:hypothetical protein